MFKKYRIEKHGSKYVITKRFFLFWRRILKCEVYQESDDFVDGVYAGGRCLYTGIEHLTFKHGFDAKTELAKLQFGRRPIKKITCRGNLVTFIDR